MRLAAILADQEQGNVAEPLPALLEAVYAAGMTGNRSAFEAALRTARGMLEDARGDGALLGYLAAFSCGLEEA